VGLARFGRFLVLRRASRVVGLCVTSTPSQSGHVLRFLSIFDDATLFFGFFVGFRAPMCPLAVFPGFLDFWSRTALFDTRNVVRFDCGRRGSEVREQASLRDYVVCFC
jgi:hypothetical protein